MTIELEIKSEALALELKGTAPVGVEVILDPTLGMRTANAGDGMWTCISIVSSIPATVFATWLASKLVKHKAERSRINHKEIHFDSEGHLRLVIEETVTKDNSS